MADFGRNGVELLGSVINISHTATTQLFYSIKMLILNDNE